MATVYEKLFYKSPGSRYFTGFFLVAGIAAIFSGQAHLNFKHLFD